MKHLKFLTSSPLHPLQMTFFILLELQLFFGERFSKFHIYGPVHLYDLLLVLLTLTSFFVAYKDRRFRIEPAFFLFIAISIIYLFWSFIHSHPLSYTVRQFVLFAYPACVFLIFFSFTSKENNVFNIRLLFLLALAAFSIQAGYHLFRWVTEAEYSLFGDFNYFNKMGVMAFVLFGPLVLVYCKSTIYRIPLIMLYLFLSTTLGHASAFLAALAVVFTFLLFRIGPAWKVAGGILLMVLLLLFYLQLPQFSDQNANWRLLYWQYTLKDLVMQYYSVLGHGFGVKYASEEIIEAMRSVLNNPWFESRPEEQYLAPMHNSFITIAFHIGILPSLLILIPLRNAGKYFYNRFRIDEDKKKDFLILSFIGVATWASFNVVLELPHSSGLFWFIYCLIIYTFQNGR